MTLADRVPVWRSGAWLPWVLVLAIVAGAVGYGRAQQRIEDHTDKLSGLERQVGELRVAVSQHPAQERRIAVLEGRADRQDERLAGIGDRLARIEAGIDGIVERLDRWERRVPHP